MLLAPKNIKYKKTKKGNSKLKSLPHPNLLVGEYSIIALESGYLHAKQLEASRQTINRHLGKKSTIYIIVFPDLGITKKPNQIRIGKGAGKTKYWVSRIQPGQTIFEISSLQKDKLKQALYSGAQKLPIKVLITMAND